MEKDKALATKSYRRLPNPPKSNRLTKAWALEVRSLLQKIDYGLFTNRKLEAPAFNIPHEWIQEVRDRMCAVLAQVNVWHDAELRKAKARKKKRERDGNDSRLWR